MSSSRRMERVILLAALALAVAATAQAQERRVVKEASKACGAGSVTVGSLGYSGIECSNCSFTLHADGTDRQWKFRSEPVITGVKPGGPADGKLKAGDVIVTIGGYLITTQEGGRLFGAVAPGEPVTLRLRRDGREGQVEITPSAECARVEAPAPPAPARAPAPAKAPAPVAIVEPAPKPVEPMPVEEVPAPPAPQASLGGRLGFSLECSRCALYMRKGENVPYMWEFRSNPTVERVEVGGPAAKAGLRGGDELLSIDGVALATAEGGERFGAIEPGDTVVLRYRRNANEADAVLVAAPQEWVVTQPVPAKAPPARAAHPVREPVPVEETTRFSGVLGETQVLVTGGPITVSRTETEIVIRSQDIVVRVRQVAPPPPKQ
jgi:hypothetical protein